MFPSSSGGLSFLKIINGISKSLSVAQQIIPIYEQTKPMVRSARNLISSFKNINKTTFKSNPKQTKKATTVSYSSSNNPTFFK